MLQAIPMFFMVITINFIIIHAAPGDPVIALAGEKADIEYLEMLTVRYGLDKPVHEQLLIYISIVLQGDLGFSYYYEQPVLNLILERMPATLLLMLTAMVFATLLGIGLGVIASKKPYSIKDSIISFVYLIGYSVPTFWLGIILILVFGLRLNLFPIYGMTSPRETYTGIHYVLDVAYHLVLPAFTCSMVYVALYTRLTRGCMLEVLTEDFITTARAKGLDENKVVYRHALKNALLPVITVVGMNTGFLFAGAVLTETVFAWPGLGRLLYQSLYARDYPMLMGILVVISASVIIANLITDIIYSYLDPRIRYT